MKYKCLLLSLFVSACGNESEPQTESKPIQISPVASQSPSPTPLAGCADAAFAGNWIDLNNNSLQFKDDCTALASNQKLTWALTDDLIHFTSDKVQIDICSYVITSTGSLTSPITIILNLACAKGGALSYNKKQ